MKYKTYDGTEKIIPPFNQVSLNQVSKIYDPKGMIYYTPIERYGRLQLKDVYSFKKIASARSPRTEDLTKVALMSEDTIEEKIRKILRDSNKTGHSPIEILDILTQKL